MAATDIGPARLAGVELRTYLREAAVGAIQASRRWESQARYRQGTKCYDQRMQAIRIIRDAQPEIRSLHLTSLYTYTMRNLNVHGTPK